MDAFIYVATLGKNTKLILLFLLLCKYTPSQVITCIRSSLENDLMVILRGFLALMFPWKPHKPFVGGITIICLDEMPGYSKLE